MLAEINPLLLLLNYLFALKLNETLILILFINNA